MSAPVHLPSSQHMARDGRWRARTVLVLRSADRAVGWPARSAESPPAGRTRMTQPLDSLLTTAARTVPERMALVADAPATYFELERRVRDFADALRVMG